MTPTDRKYAKTHEWAKEDGDTVIVGISDHAQEALGDITFVDLPQVGQTVEKETECAVIESVKAASDIYAPVSGEISAVNSSLEEAPETINKDPYDSGWLFKLTKVSKEDLAGLMDATGYDNSIKEEQ